MIDVNSLLPTLRPANMLIWLIGLRPVFEKPGSDGVIVREVGLDRTSGNPSPDDLERLDRDAPLIREQLEGDEAFARLMARLESVGVRHEFGGQGDACGHFTVLRFKARSTAFPALEALAADDAGITDSAERKAAAERFRIYTLRNHDENWRANRERYPDVGGCPYSDPSTWPRET